MWCFVENFSLTPGFSRVRKMRAGKNRLNGFSWARSWFTALKRGVNKMISTEQECGFLPKAAALLFRGLEI
jgi:hypothetical protein